jgi:fucose permease
LQTSGSTSTLPVAASRRALAGFVVSGLLLSLPGAILPAWGYHLRPHYVTVGNYFLMIPVGVLLGVLVARRMLRARGTRPTLVLACSVAFAAILALALTAPPASEYARLPGLIGVGCAAGLLNSAIFPAISPAYRINPAATVNLGGTLFGLGSLVCPLLIAGTFDFYSLPRVLLPVALVPAVFAVSYSRSAFPAEQVRRERPLKDVLREFTIPGAVLLALLLFVQFGNEWAIAGWLPLFLIQRLGMSTSSALILLGAFWIAVTLGRLTVQAILPYVSHFFLLLGSAVAALTGCLILTFTNNAFGAWFGTLLLGFGFAPIYPLVVERIGARFPHYHPGFFNGVFSAGLTGGMLAPATLGYAGEFFGIRVVTALPALGTFVVVILVLAIWLEAKLADWNSANPQRGRRA